MICQIGDIILIEKFKDAYGREVSRHPFIVIDDRNKVIAGMDYDFISVMTTSYKGKEDNPIKDHDPSYVFLPVESGMKKPSHAIPYNLYYFDNERISYQIVGTLNSEYFYQILDMIDELEREGYLREVTTNLEK